MELKDTVKMMNSDDYKERFRAEYYQTKIRYEKLKKFNTKIEAANTMKYEGKYFEMPKHINVTINTYNNDHIKMYKLT